MSKYDVNNFIRGFTQLCEETEIPSSFAAWSAIAGVSCALGRRCYLDWGTFQIYPNEYICFVGASAVVRKSTSINMLEDMLREIDPPPNIIGQKLTPEALIIGIQTKEPPSGTLVSKPVSCTGFIIADEFGTLLSKQTYEMGISPVLIQFYDCKRVFEYKTKTSGIDILRDTCLGILAGTTLIWMSRSIPEDAIGDGLTSRIIFVYEDQPMPPVAVPVFSEAKRHLRGELIKRLQLLSQIKGEFFLTREAIDYAVKDYNEFRDSKLGKMLYANKFLQGYAGRRQLHQLKISMLIAAARLKSPEQDKLITLDDMQGATELLQMTEKALTKVVKIITSSQQGILIAEIESHIRKGTPVDDPTKSGRKAWAYSRQQLVRELYSRYSVHEVELALETLKQAGILHQMTTSDGKLLLVLTNFELDL